MHEAQSAGAGEGRLMANMYRAIEFYVSLEEFEEYQRADGSRSAVGRPIELFLQFDTPSSFAYSDDFAERGGFIQAMDMRVYYE